MSATDTPPQKLTLQRLDEIETFHHTLTQRLHGDGAPLNGFERAILLGIMAELIEHAERTV